MKKIVIAAFTLVTMIFTGCLREKREIEVIETEKHIISVYVPNYESEKESKNNECYFGSIGNLKSNSDIKVIFQSEVDYNSVNENTVFICDSKGKKVSGEIAIGDDGKSLYLKNVNGFKSGSSYFLKLTKMLKMKDGKNNLKSSMIMELTGEAAKKRQIQLPETTGEYGVGTAYLQLKDEKREEILSENGAKNRELSIQVWYPVDKNSEECRASYANYMIKKFCVSNKIIEKGKLESIVTNSQMNMTAATGGKKFPVLIFSHGLGIENMCYQGFIEEIVSHGYIVYSVSHTYFAGITAFYDGKDIANGYFRIENCCGFEPESEEGRKKIKNDSYIVIDDLKFVISKLKELNEEKEYILAGKMDVENIGIYGHSYGGYAAVAASEMISECKASIDIDGAILNSIPNFTKPVYFIRSNSEIAKKYGENSIEESWGYIKSNGYMTEIKDAMHLDFIDFKYIGFEGVYGSVNSKELISYVNKTVVGYFDIYLKGKEESEFLKSVISNPNAVFSKK